uniref:PiggyBac transposable element-derived protein 3-like n=1 Tax=Diabrotica virgifera virgifera TaxID=50390 RepID=A0A6P7F7U5_DIAVI
MYIYTSRGFSLNDALAMLEEEEDMIEHVESLTISPPENATDSQTDEDSGDEDTLTINNLPAK